MKRTITRTTVLCTLLCALIITSCGNNRPKRGEDLKENDALELLAGKTEKCWKLVSGKDFLTLMCFSTDGKFRDQTDYKTTYTLNGASIVIKDYKDLLFTIVEISDKKMTLNSAESGTLVYEETNDKPVTNGKLTESL